MIKCQTKNYKWEAIQDWHFKKFKIKEKSWNEISVHKVFSFKVQSSNNSNFCKWKIQSYLEYQIAYCSIKKGVCFWFIMTVQNI